MLSTLMAPLKQAFSSDSSLQSGLPLQKSSFSRHSPSPQDSLPSGQMGSSVFRIGLTLRGSKRKPIQFNSIEQSELSSCGRSSKQFINQILTETVSIFYGKLPADVRINIIAIQEISQQSTLHSALVTIHTCLDLDRMFSI
uniref:Uncharacterized protein n=1 Tax=Glossina palpalis gambiensis TaxID=67801 RepID=A0A1B0ANM5_9MUSC